MNGRYLLDTNLVIALFAEDRSVQQRLSEASEIFVPSIVLGELYYGAWKSGQMEANLSRIEEFASRMPVLGCDLETAQHYGRIKNSLRAKGRPIPENDIWIAAVAGQHHLVLVARDTHFEAVDGLVVENW